MHSPTKKLLYDAFILATLVLQVQSCNLTGLWQNELGSTLHVQAVGSELTGMYKTKVGTGSQESGPDQVGKLVGVVSHHDQQTSVAFSVLWETGACSSWVGQCFPLPDGKRILKTLWMLRSMALSPADNWKSTRMGEDTFILEHGAAVPDPSF